MVFRPDSASASATPPPMPAVGTEGYYTDGSPPSIPPTTVDAWYLHTLVEEIRNVVVGAGITPNKALVNQQLQAIKRICAANRMAISSNGTLVADNAGLVMINAAAGPITLTLPAVASASALPLEFIFVRTDTSTNTVTVQDAGSDTDAPGGATSATVSPGSPLWISGDGVSVWDIVWSGGNYALLSQVGVPNRSAQFTSSGTWTCPAGVTSVLVNGAAGGGGGGGGSATSYAVGGGGGGGGCSYFAPLTVSPGTVYTITIGAAGAAGTSTTAGGAGGNTTFGALLTLTGGGGGAVGGAGNAAGGAAGNSLAQNGDAGVLSSQYNTNTRGGNSFFGSGGPVTGNGIAGGHASGYGGGGGGGATNQAGGAGSAGFIEIFF